MSKEDHSQHFVGNIAQKALIEQDGKVLMVQYPDDDHKAALLWDLPGGRLHNDEDPITGVKREVKEEINADIVVNGIIATGVNVVSKDFKLYWVIYRASLVNPKQLFIPEVGEIGKVEWRERADFFTLPMIYTGYHEALKNIL